MSLSESYDDRRLIDENLCGFTWVHDLSMAGRTVLGQSLWAGLRTARRSDGLAEIEGSLATRIIFILSTSVQLVHRARSRIGACTAIYRKVVIDGLPCKCVFVECESESESESECECECW